MARAMGEFYNDSVTFRICITKSFKLSLRLAASNKTLGF